MAITKDLRALMLLAGSKAEASEMEQLRGRLTSVARILIEQHADVNATVDGLSILELSCRWKDWETIALLLKHHAHVSPSTLLQFRSLTDQRKFTAMVQSASVESVRPPRLDSLSQIVMAKSRSSIPLTMSVCAELAKLM